MGLVGLPTTTRSASSGTCAVSSTNGGFRTTWCAVIPAALKAMAGSVNAGTTIAARTGLRLCSNANPSAAPTSGSTSSRVLP
ncbi:Uncharacterised protein [Mycobacterium tuberculosis]|uniref:Uncharacterized protein n=1 Tax=Mycobacterium tuberculosis TaxID=1773 RepID=A0A916P9I6_MYCTX|nr:Uncharacterised protein [Mycobacterium tuberculosis]CPA13835.1 Uncharacterised protein [Mycobacterium tuberculosis]CPA23710.1 Uncharacterised protein [Mycobacterium tuberculosis]